MRIGLFFGTFDPIHLGHIELAKNTINQKMVDVVWFVISPTSPFKQLNKITDKEHRLKMVQIAIKHNESFVASDVEFDMSSPHYTAHTLRRIKDIYPQDCFKIIMGSDNYCNFSTWYHYEYISQNFKLLIYRRKGHQADNINNNTLIAGDYLDLSSSKIRENFNEFALHSLDKKVYRYIKRFSLY